MGHETDLGTRERSTRASIADLFAFTDINNELQEFEFQMVRLINSQQLIT